MDEEDLFFSFLFSISWIKPAKAGRREDAGDLPYGGME